VLNRAKKGKIAWDARWFMKKAIHADGTLRVSATFGLFRIRKLLRHKTIENGLHMLAHRKFCRIGIMIANRFQDRRSIASNCINHLINLKDMLTGCLSSIKLTGE
jgi:hypothetical protein